MKIWVDGDACPRQIKEIVFRAAVQREICVMIVANHFLAIPRSVWIRFIQVSSGFDRADQYIIEQGQENDLIITADIRLAKHVLDKNMFALNPRGFLYTPNNIQQTLAMRDFHEVLRDAGIISGGPSTLGAKDIQKFSQEFDKILQKNHR